MNGKLKRPILWGNAMATPKVEPNYRTMPDPHHDTFEWRVVDGQRQWRCMPRSDIDHPTWRTPNPEAPYSPLECETDARWAVWIALALNPELP